MLSFYIVTDTHYYENSLGIGGKIYDEYIANEQMTLAENSTIVRSVFSKLAADKDTNIVILPGDLSKDGEKESHKSFVKELEKLKAAGKKIYVITALHDFNEHPRSYGGDEWHEVEGTEREELYDLYYDYGFSDAIAVDRKSMSYVAEIAPKVRMMALNCDGSPEENVRGGFYESQLNWIKEQADDAKKNGCFVFAICHYPILLGSPFFEFVGDAKVKNYRYISSFLANCGISLVFTGHMHMQSIKCKRTESGNIIYDVSTAAPVGAPAQYRKITICDNGTVDVKSIEVPSFDWDMQGLSVKQYFDRQFSTMLVNKIDGFASKNKILKHVLDKYTLGKICRLLWIKPDESIKDIRLKDFSVEIAMNIFAGDQPYTKGTAVYNTFVKVLSRVRPIIKIVNKKLSNEERSIDLETMILETIGNNRGMSDYDAVLKFN